MLVQSVSTARSQLCLAYHVFRSQAHIPTCVCVCVSCTGIAMFVPCTSVYAQNSSLEADVLQSRAEVSTKDKELQDALAELVSVWLDNHGID